MFRGKFIRKFKRFAAFVICISMLASLAACKGAGSDDITDDVLEEDVTINLWYTSSLYTAYFEECAAKYHDANKHVTVELKRIEDEDYLNKIYDECVRSDSAVDVFMLPSDDVQQAYLMGLMRANTSSSDVYNEQTYGKNAITASSYKDKLVGYPLTFESAVMVYNKKFAQEFATFDEITTFSDNFQFTEENEGVTQVIGWDVSDVSLNYAFLGEYMNVGGDAADDVTKTYLQDDKIKEAINAFVGFKDAYGIIRNNINYEEYLMRFMSGSLLYTIVKTNDLAAINQSGVEYEIMAVPDYNSNLKTKAAARTYMLAVPSYSSNPQIAESVAKAFTYDYAEMLNEKASMPAARVNLENQPPQYAKLLSAYSEMSLKARYMEIGDYYVNMEIMLHKSWDGSESVDEAYETFKNYVMTTMKPKSNASAQ